MIRQNRISPRQLRRMVFVETFGAAALSFPAAACRGGLSGLLPILFYAVLLALTAVWFLWLVKKWEIACPEQSKKGYGFVVNKWVGALYFLRFFVNAAALTAFFVQSIREIYLPRMSVLLILLPVTVLLGYTVRTDLQKRARFLELIFPWIFVTLTLSVLLAFLGIGEAMSSVGDLWRGAFADSLPESFRNAYLLLLGASPLEFLLFLKPAAGENLWTGEREEKKVRISLFTAVAGSVLFGLIFTFLSVRTMGSALTADSRFPVVKMMQLIRLPGGFLERFDILPAVFWLLCFAGVASGYLSYGRMALSGAFFPKTFLKNVDDGKEFPEKKDMPHGSEDGSGKKRRKWRLGIGAALIVLLFVLFALAALFPAVWEGYLLYKMWVDFPLSLLLPLTVFFGRKKCRRSAVLLPCILAVLLSLTGCQRLTDVEEKSYVLSLYVDIVEAASPASGESVDAAVTESGESAAIADESAKYDFYVARADLNEMQEREERIPCQVTHVQAESLAELEEKYRNTVPGEIEWNHIYTIFLGPRIATSPQRRCEFLKEWDDAWQKSPNVLLALCSEKPEKLYQAKEIPEGAAGQEVSLLAEQAKDSLSENLCETPVDYLRISAENPAKISLYRATLENGEIVLGTGCVAGS